MKNIPELPRPSGTTDSGSAEGGKNVRLAADIDIEHMSITELLSLHTRIEAALPPLTLKNISLEKTLMLQLLAAQALQKETLEDADATPTQKSQVTNTLSGVIDTLSKLQIKLFSSERMKEIEGVLIDMINEHCTPEQQVFFMAEYRRRLGADSV